MAPMCSLAQLTTQAQSWAQRLLVQQAVRLLRPLRAPLPAWRARLPLPVWPRGGRFIGAIIEARCMHASLEHTLTTTLRRVLHRTITERCCMRRAMVCWRSLC